MCYHILKIYHLLPTFHEEERDMLSELNLNHRECKITLKEINIVIHIF